MPESNGEPPIKPHLPASATYQEYIGRENTVTSELFLLVAKCCSETTPRKDKTSTGKGVFSDFGKRSALHRADDRVERHGKHTLIRRCGVDLQLAAQLAFRRAFLQLHG